MKRKSHRSIRITVCMLMVNFFPIQNLDGDLSCFKGMGSRHMTPSNAQHCLLPEPSNKLSPTQLSPTTKEIVIVHKSNTNRLHKLVLLNCVTQQSGSCA